MKVAFCSNDGAHVDEHFGKTEKFVVYDIYPDRNERLEDRIVEGTYNDTAEEHAKIFSRIETIKDCAILYTMAIGPAAAAHVVKVKIHPIKVKEQEVIADVVGELQKVLNNPPIWLKKRLIEEEEEKKTPEEASR